MASTHDYQARVVWDGNTGEGTAAYARYAREYRVLVAGKPDLAGSADPAFRGLAERHNPEDLFLAALSACHMLFFLALCARNGICVLAYEDAAEGRMVTSDDGSGRFEAVTLRPRVILAEGSDPARAARLHETAHERCFIANSCRVPIRVSATAAVEAAAARAGRA
jgi:organic hydroperoxide reductase OsmC/OhrA